MANDFDEYDGYVNTSFEPDLNPPVFDVKSFRDVCNEVRLVAHDIGRLATASICLVAGGAAGRLQAGIDRRRKKRNHSVTIN